MTDFIEQANDICKKSKFKAIKTNLSNFVVQNLTAKSLQMTRNARCEISGNGTMILIVQKHKNYHESRSTGICYLMRTKNIPNLLKFTKDILYH